MAVSSQSRRTRRIAATTPNDRARTVFATSGMRVALAPRLRASRPLAMIHMAASADTQTNMPGIL